MSEDPRALNEDLHVIANSDDITIEMMDDDLQIIQKLSDEPNDEDGLSAAELKARFDQAGLTIQKYINETLIPQVLGSDLTEANREAQETQRQANETQRQTQETARQNAEAQRQTAQEAFFDGVKAAAYTLPPDAQATASAVRAGDSFRVNFGIPKGDKGDKGDPGDSNLPTPVSSSRPQMMVVDANSGEAKWKEMLFPAGGTTSSLLVAYGSKPANKVPDHLGYFFLPRHGRYLNSGIPGQVYTLLGDDSADWADLPPGLPQPSSGKSDAQLMIAKGVSGEAEWREITETPWSGPGSKRFLTVDGMNAPSGVESGFLPSTATGTAGQVFTKTGTNTADWADPSVPKPPEVPAGETGWYIPVYGFGPGADFSVTWKEVTEETGESLSVQHFLLDNGPGMYTRAGFLPSATAGGKAGQVFTRLSEVTADWTDPPKGIPAGGTEGQVLSKTGSEDYSVAWTDLPAAENNSLNAVVTYSSAPAENGIYVFSESNGGIVWNRAPLENESFSGVWVSTDSQSVYYVFGKFSGSASGGPYVPGEQSVVLVEKTTKIVDDAASKSYVNTAISTAITGAMEASY